MENKTYKLPSCVDIQHGGGHYKERGIQPIEFAQANNLDWKQFNVVKYTTRHKDKNGAEDLKKAIHYLQMALEFDYGIRSQVEYDAGLSSIVEIRLPSTLPDAPIITGWVDKEVGVLGTNPPIHYQTNTSH